MKKFAVTVMSLSILLLSFNFMPAQTTQEMGISWEQISTPGNVEELVVLDNHLFARTKEAIFKSEDCGDSWNALSIGLNTGLLHAMDVDLQALYVASQNGVVVSQDVGKSFVWSLLWSWDDSRDVDFKNGFGWLAIDMWGSRSGPNGKTPTGTWELRRGNIPWPYMSMDWVSVDPLEPDNVAYIGGIGKFRTLDGGASWTPIENRIIFTAMLDGKPVAFGNDKFTEDRGETWQPLGINVTTLAKDEETGGLFAARSGGGIYTGHPGQWNPYGAPSQNIRSLVVCRRQLLAVSTEGEIFRANIVENPVYYYLYLPLVFKNR